MNLPDLINAAMDVVRATGLDKVIVAYAVIRLGISVYHQLFQR